MAPITIPRWRALREQIVNTERTKQREKGIYNTSPPPMTPPVPASKQFRRHRHHGKVAADYQTYGTNLYGTVCL